MQNNLFRRIVAMILVCTLLTGQFMIGSAYSDGDIFLFDENGNIIENGIPEEPAQPETPQVPEAPVTPETPEIPEAPVTPEVPEDSEDSEIPEVPEDSEDSETPEIPEDSEDSETPEIPEDSEDSETPEIPEDSEDSETPEDPEDSEDSEESEEADGEEEEDSDDLILEMVGDVLTLLGEEPEALAEGDPLEVKITSDKTTVKDGETVTLVVSVFDSDAQVEPNISNSTVTINLPSYLRTQSLDSALGNGHLSNLDRDKSRYDAATNTIILVYSEQEEETNKRDISLSLQVDLSNYDENDKDFVVLPNDGSLSVETLPSIDINTGEAGDGEGTGNVTQGNPATYLTKKVWYNVNVNSSGSVSIKDINKPVGYTLSMGIKDDYTDSITMYDNLAGGNLTLCTSSGELMPEGGNVSNYITVEIGGQNYSLPSDNTPLGAVSAVASGTGFQIVFTQDDTPGEGTAVPVVVRYYAKVTGATAKINNQVTLSNENGNIGSDQEEVMRSSQSSLFLEKFILENGVQKDVIELDPSQESAVITFRIKMTQFSDELSALEAGKVIVVDVLNAKFTYLNQVTITGPEEGVDYSGYFTVAHDGSRTVTITKKNTEKLKAGEYNVDFNVSVNPSQVAPGEALTNSVNNSTVFIRRDAELTVEKTWLHWEDNQDKIAGGATIGLYTAKSGGNQVGNTITVPGNNAVETGTIKFNSDDLGGKGGTFWLREVVPYESIYKTAQPIPVVIKVNGKEVDIVSINGVSTADPSIGAGTAPISNEPDDQKGDLLFKKYDQSNNALDGGKFQLYRKTDAGDVAIGDVFTTVNGEKKFTDLEYGTYYVKEISAPEGYLIVVPGTTKEVTLNKNNAIDTVELTNERYTGGKISIVKTDDTDAKQPLSGVEFTLKKLPEGTTVTATTNASGVAEFPNLVAGIYELTETQAKFGYSGFKGPYYVRIDTTGTSQNLNAQANTGENASSGSDITVSWKNTQQFGNLKLIKYGKPQNGEKSPLKGAEFALYDSNGKVLKGYENLKTNDNGEFIVEGLPYGTYYLKETKAPAGFELNSSFSSGKGYEFHINSSTLENGWLTLECINQTTQGSVTITKFTKYTQGETEKTTNLSGVQFGLYSDAAATQLIANEWTNSEGVCSFRNLEAGVYYVKEITGLDGFKTDSTVYPVYVNVENNGNAATWQYQLAVENEPYLYRVRVLKKDATSEEVLQGAEFTLTGTSIFGKTYSITKTTGADGIAEFTGLPYGEYKIKETGFPQGYAQVAEDISVVISNEAREDNALAFETTAQNKRTRLTVYKNDSATSQPLAGAQFKIKNAAGNYITAQDSGNGLYVYTGTAAGKDSATTFQTVMAGDTASFQVEKLPIADGYVLEEIAPPDGYLDQQTTTGFHIRYEQQSVTVGNTLVRGDLRILKTDGSGKVLQGIRFKLTNAAGDVTVKKVSDGQYSFDPNGELIEMETIADGSLRVTGLTLGIYNLVETYTPSGLVNAGAITVNVGQEQHQQEIFLNVINNLNTDAVSFRKIDNTGAPLQGAMFKLVLLDALGNPFAGENGNEYYATSGYDGVVTFDNIPSGVYALSEYVAPAGKVLSTQTFYVRVGVEADQVSQEIREQYKELPVNYEWVNDDIQIITTVKKVSEDGVTFAPGAEFKILNENKEPISFVIHGTQEYTESFVVNQPEGVEIELPVGIYYLQEIKSADDHILNSEPQMFTVKESGSNVVIMKNTRYRGSLMIRKSDENGEALAGAEFTGYLRSEYEEKGTEATVQFRAVVNSEGFARVEDLVAGEYIVLETKAPAGYIGDATGKIARITNLGADGGKEIVLEFVNTRAQYWIEIIKEDISDDQILLAGATFSVAGENFYQEVTTDETGKASLEVPRPGVYTITEINAPEGYTIATNAGIVTVTEQVTMAPTKVTYVSRDHVTKLLVTKVDENGEALDGAVFQILRGEEIMYFTGSNGVYTCVSGDTAGAVTELTTANGQLRVTKLPLGDYTLKEVSAPEGYMNLGDVVLRISGTDDQENFAEVKNVRYERGVGICKADEDGIRLADATFALCQENGVEIAREVTSASGYAIFKDLPMGSYYIREKAAPDGYKLDDRKIEFQIDASGNLVSEHPFKNLGNEETPFFVLDFVNHPEEYELKIRKVSANDPDMTLEHAQFRVMGNGYTETVSTDAEGIAVFKLTVGEYMLTEVKAPDGYMADPVSHHILVTSTEIQIDGETLTGDTLIYTVENAPEDFRMRLVKVDSVTGKRLAGAGFTIYDSQQNVVHSLVSNDNGETNAVAMRPGTYYIQETVAPDGYLRPMSTWTLEITEEGDIRCDNVKGVNYDREKRLLTLTVANQRTKGNLLIYKHDADDKTVALEGARFRLIDEAGNAVKFTVKNGVYHADTAGNVNSFTTGADGKIHIEQLPVGEYKLYELEAPAGYAAWTETPILVKLTHADEEMRVDVANEKEQRTVRLIKEDSDGVKLIGAEFTLYNTDGQSPIPVAKGTTGSDGIVEFQVTYGSYQIFETAAPAGHELIQGPVATFTFDEDTGEEETFTFTVVNVKSKYALEVYKHEKGNPNKGLKGAEFAVTNSLGFTKVITTGADGIARLDDIVYDDYTIREVKAPEGYYLTDQTYTVKRTDLVHGAVLRYEFANEPVIGAVYLKKVDHMNREKLLNAEFTVTDQKGNVLLWEKTAAGYRVSTTGTKTILAGNVKLEGLPMGTYTIKEVKAPEGYIILEESREFSITEKNALAEIVIEITNLQRMTAVGIVKMDADKLSERLAGAEFTVYPLLPNGREGAAIKSVVTDQTGMAIFNDLTVGTYRIRETKAPYGYEMVVKAVDFKIQEDGKVVLLNNNAEVSAPNQVHLIGVTNKAIQKDFVISKVCAVTGKVLKGATFTITGGNTSVELTTGKDGLAKVKLPYGEYVLQEVIAPDGYVRDTEKHLLKVSANGVTVDGKLLNGFTYVVRNVPVKIPVILHKQDKCGRNPLKDAEFTITGYCTELKLKTDANGNTKLFYLEPGDYKITETVAPKGYVKPLTSWVLRVTKDGKMCAVGSYAIRASDCGTMIIILENEKANNGGGSGGSGGGSGGGYGGGSGGSGGGGGSVSVSGITKTGETFNRTMFASGVALTMVSAMGLVVLYLDERKRRRMLMS